VGVHLVGGAFGAISLGFRAVYPFAAGQHKGLFYGGGFHQLAIQVLGPVAVGLYSFTVAYILGKIIDKTIGFRVSEEDEVTGVDLSEHAETAYDNSGVPASHSTVLVGVRPEAGPGGERSSPGPAFLRTAARSGTGRIRLS
jgi:Amt family ammonium transporter